MEHMSHNLCRKNKVCNQCVWSLELFYSKLRWQRLANLFQYIDLDLLFHVHARIQAYAISEIDISGKI